MPDIETTGEVIDALGGNAAAAKLFGVPYNSITNWRSANQFPTDTYLMIQKELKLRKLTAADALWSMREAVAVVSVKKRKAKTE